MLQECSAWVVGEVFFQEPTEEHYLSEISRKSGIAHTSVKNHLETLGEESIIETQIEEKGERTYPRYRATMNQEYRFYKKIHLLQQLHTSGLVEHLVDRNQPDCIILFGSAARGEDTETSDIDLYIQAEERDHDLKEFEKQLNREIQLHTGPEFQEYPKELRNNIINGITLHGFLQAEQ
ncbi:MAG: nucleotidyltransferase domain-containing protein [Candidatus Nanohaloarchaeota archaeon QJJ-7]|nr:nucleotidyltransferase domain-containing protein [Candidatus Nanohaloarchaeota archaeon QJJ-7]